MNGFKIGCFIVFLSPGLAHACDGVLANTANDSIFTDSLMMTGSEGQEQWNEVHCTNGLWEAARGLGHATDPSKIVGSWSIDVNGNLNHNYGSPSTTYSYKVFKLSEGSYCFDRINPEGQDIAISTSAAPGTKCQQ